MLSKHEADAKSDAIIKQENKSQCYSCLLLTVVLMARQAAEDETTIKFSVNVPNLH